MASLGDPRDPGAHAGHVLCLHDVSALRRSLQARHDADAQVLEKQQLLQAIIDEIPAVVAYLDREGRSVLANRTAVLGGFALRGNQGVRHAGGLQRHLLDEHRIQATLRGVGGGQRRAAGRRAPGAAFACKYQPHRREFCSGRIDLVPSCRGIDVTDGVRRQHTQLVGSEQRFP